MARRHANGRYRHDGASTGNGTGLDLERVYVCEQPSDEFGDTLSDPRGLAIPDPPPTHTQPYPTIHQTPLGRRR